jgi:rSAM/selenodomain-associated transferase 2
MRLLTGTVVDRANQRDEKAKDRREMDRDLRRATVTDPAAGTPRHRPAAARAISVVVPALDEELLLPRCLASLEDQIEHEVIVVDGGSRDRTVQLAQCAGALIERSPRANRGLQLNLGARRARGEVLLFLHADSCLPRGALAAVETLLSGRPDVVGGCFTMRLDSRSPVCRLASWGGDLYHRTGRPLFGDRAVFVRRDAFEAVGGFRELPIMEDVDLGRRLRRLRPPGRRGRLVMLSGPVITSARAFKRLGGLRLLARILLACVAYRCGLPVDRIARLCPSSAGAGSSPIDRRRQSGSLRQVGHPQHGAAAATSADLQHPRAAEAALLER